MKPSDVAEMSDHDLKSRIRDMSRSTKYFQIEVQALIAAGKDKGKYAPKFKTAETKLQAHLKALELMESELSTRIAGSVAVESNAAPGTLMQALQQELDKALSRNRILEKQLQSEDRLAKRFQAVAQIVLAETTYGRILARARAGTDGDQANT